MYKKLKVASALLFALTATPIASIYAEDTIEDLEQEIKVLQEKLNALKAEKYQEYAPIKDDDEPIIVHETFDYGTISVYDFYLFDDGKDDDYKSFAIVAKYENNTLYSNPPSMPFYASFEIYQYDDNGNKIKIEPSTMPEFINSKDHNSSELSIEPEKSVNFEYYLKLRSDTNPIEVYFFNTDTLVTTLELDELEFRE